jgi:aspartyl/glutamyl-tRNA(Asn/Gln) amidotransferase C subunit
MDLIGKVKGIENVEPMTHTLDDFEYELREDVVEESVPIDDLLSNCDDVSGREVEVPKVVG